LPLKGVRVQVPPRVPKIPNNHAIIWDFFVSGMLGVRVHHDSHRDLASGTDKIIQKQVRSFFISQNFRWGVRVHHDSYRDLASGTDINIQKLLRSFIL
jgi:hypothetical protein